MNRDLFKAAERVRQENRQGQAVIALTVGGGLSVTAKNPEAFPFDVVVHIDVPAEFERCAQADNVLRIPLADGETLATLLSELAPDEIPQSLVNQPGITLRTGLAQAPQIGALVGNHLVQDAAFRALIMQYVVDPLHIIHNGCIKLVQLYNFASISGGTGNPIAPIACSTVTAILLDVLDVPVESRLCRLGSRTFTGVGERVHINGAAGVAEDLEHFACAPPAHPKEVRQLHLFELPAVEGHQEQRDMFAALTLQALLSTTVRQVLDALQPNEAFGHRLGAVTTIQPGFYSGLTPEQVANYAAAVYRSDLRKLVTPTNRRERVLRFEVRPTYRPSADAVSIDSLVKEIIAARRVRPGNFLERCVLTDTTLHATELVIQLAGERTESTQTSLRERYATPPTTLDECAERLSELATLEQRAAEYLETLRKQERKLAREFKLAELALKFVLERIWPQSIWAIPLSISLRPKRKIVQFRNAVRKARELKEQLCFAQEAVVNVTAAHAFFTRERKAEVQRIERLHEAIDSLSTPPGDDPLIVVRPFNEVFGKLLAIPNDEKTGRPAVAEVIRVLSGSCEHVTAEGLELIVEADDCRPESIARVLAANSPNVLAPPWAGGTNNSAGVCLAVVPTIPRGLFTELREALRTLNPEIHLHMASSAIAGVNVVTLHVKRPRKESDVLPPFLAKQRKLAERQHEVYFTRSSANHKPQLVHRPK